MAGIYGSSACDRAMERDLDRYLDRLSTFECGYCEYQCDDDQVDQDDDGRDICPSCERLN